MKFQCALVGVDSVPVIQDEMKRAAWTYYSLEHETVRGTES